MQTRTQSLWVPCKGPKRKGDNRMLNQKPILSLRNVTLSPGASVAASSFISGIVDPESNPIASYAFWDAGVGGGHFVLNGVIQPAGKWIVVSAANLASLSYVGATGTSAERIFVTVNDGTSWSATMTSLASTVAPVNHRPVVTASNISLSANASVAASTLIGTVSDVDGDAITKYSFLDAGLGGGHFVLNGVAQAANTWITVDAANLASLSYVGAGATHNEQILVRAFDGSAWSVAASAVASITNHAAVVTPAAVSVEAFAAVSASSFITSAVDPDGDAIKSYGFMDTAGGGYFLLNGLKQAAGAWITVKADQLGALSYVGAAAAGSEQIKIRAFDGKVWSTPVTATVTSTTAAGDPWSMLSDAGIKADVTRLVVGNSLGYAGLLKILQDAAVGGITSSEFVSLKTLDGLFNATGGITVSNYLDDIADRLINGDAANMTWTGGGATHVALGNLASGTTQTQMDRLIGKWLLGTDLPTALGSYKVDSDPLFGGSGGPSYGNVNQGSLGDCYLLASLAEIALRDPGIIKSMFTDNGNGTYGVRFFVNGVAEYVTVDNRLPYDPLAWDNGSYLEYANGSVKWAALAEKAYVQLNASGGTAGHTAGNDYSLIDGGWADPLSEITGKSYDTWWSTDYMAESGWEATKSAIVQAVNAGQEVLVGSGSADTGNLVGNHMFAVLGYSAGSDTFTLYNPWGTASSSAGVSITFQASMADLYANQATVMATTGSALA